MADGADVRERRAAKVRADAVIWASAQSYADDVLTVLTPPHDHVEAVELLRVSLEKRYAPLKVWSDAAVVLADIESAEAMAGRLQVADALTVQKGPKMEAVKKLQSAWADLHRLENVDVQTLLGAYLECLRILAGSDTADVFERARQRQAAEQAAAAAAG